MRSPSGTLTVLLTLPLAAGAARAQDTAVEAEPEVHGAAAAFSLVEEQRQRVWVPEGSPLFEAPDAASSRLAIIDALSEIEVLEQSGDWYRVHFAGRTGWVEPDLPRHERSLDTFPSPELVPVTTPGFEIADTTRRREIALEALGLTEPNGRLGPWELLTDVTDPDLIAYLDRIASGLAASYRERFRLEPAPPEDQAVAVFSTEAGYRPFESEATHLAGQRARGHSGSGLAALFIENDRLEEASTLMVHELTHLMNRAALGPTPPPWVEEGIANDLAYSRVKRDGSLVLGSINGERVVFGNRRVGVSYQYSGAVAALAELLRLRARHRSTPLEELVALDQDRFLESGRRRQHYIESAFLVRFLLEADKGRHAEGFRRYLAALGDDPSARVRLIDHLDADWGRLERALDAWLRVQSAQLLR